MDLTTYFIATAVAIVLVYAVIIYNGLVRIKHYVSKSWANIDVLLKQRHDELPKLIEVCKGYMKHERETFEAVMKARSMAADALQNEDVKKVGQSETMMRQGLGQLYVAVEDYPELKANEQFKHLQNRITALENQIADRREFYNESVTVNNTRIEMIPDVIIAKLFGFKERQLLQFSEAELADVDMQGAFES